jgi:hypothetical protein
MFNNIVIFTVWSFFLQLALNPSWRTTFRRLSATVYLIYSQLPSISAGRSSIRNLRTRHAVVTGTHLSCIYLETERRRMKYSTIHDSHNCVFFVHPPSTVQVIFSVTFFVNTSSSCSHIKATGQFSYPYETVDRTNSRRGFMCNYMPP